MITTSDNFFTKMVDRLVEHADHDQELMDGIKYIDEKGRKKGLSFYDAVFEELYKADINQKARKWRMQN